jgi:hypothetical protein
MRRRACVTFHGPVGISAWGKQSLETFKPLLFDAATPDYVNPVASEDRLVQRKWRTQTITPGKARGRLLGGNLTVMTALVGTPYLPDFDGAILFFEDIDEAVYRIDRMLTQLGQAGILGRVAGVIVGNCTDCSQGNSIGGFTLSEILTHHLKPLGVPAYSGAFIGHLTDQFTVPEGGLVEMDADAGSFRLLEPAVRVRLAGAFFRATMATSIAFRKFDRSCFVKGAAPLGAPSPRPARRSAWIARTATAFPIEASVKGLPFGPRTRAPFSSARCARRMSA